LSWHSDFEQLFCRLFVRAFGQNNSVQNGQRFRRYIDGQRRRTDYLMQCARKLPRPHPSGASDPADQDVARWTAGRPPPFSTRTTDARVAAVLSAVTTLTAIARSRRRGH
jgi:hypothetical protein